MEKGEPLGIEFGAPYSCMREAVSSSRYRWNCWDRSSVEFVIVQWTLSGEGIFESQKGRFPVPARHAFIAVVPERSTYYYPPRGGKPWVFSWLNLYGPLACLLFREFRDRFGSVLPLAPQGAAAAYFRRLLANQERLETRRFEASLHAYAFLLEWWRETALPMRSSGPRWERALHFCKEHFREPLGIKEVAAEAGMSREHLSRVFTARTGQSPSAYLEGLRMEEAAGFIRSTHLPLNEIAMRSGFSSARHLMHAWKRIYKTNPSAHRPRKGGSKKSHVEKSKNLKSSKR
jgi:AraC-like DNA-binding protein